MVLRLSNALERDLRAILEMVGRVGFPVLVVAAHRFLARIDKERKPEPLVRPQFPLWEEDGSPWRGRLGPDAQIRCAHFDATIPLKTCLQRQDARWPGKRAPIHEYCASGECALGAMNRIRAAYSTSEDWANRSKNGKASYQFYRKDAGIQRRRRRVYLQSQPDRILSDEEPGADVDLEDEDVRDLLRGEGG